MGSIPATPSSASTKHVLCFPPSSMPASIQISIKLIVSLSVQHWERMDFIPEPTEIVHFDGILPRLKLLCQLQFPVRLVKIKNHAGCLLNEGGEEQAEAGYTLDTPEVFPAPEKFASQTLRVR